MVKRSHGLVMSMVNYLDLLNVPAVLLQDPKVLRRNFFKLSLEAHPDKNGGDDAANLQFADINKAYEVLSNKDKTIRYVLQWKEVIQKDSKEQPAMDFLMEMMDINEGLMDLEMDAKGDTLNTLQSQVENIDLEIETDIKALEAKDIMTFEEKDFDELKNYYYKKRYLLRIFEKLDKFASL